MENRYRPKVLYIRSAPYVLKYDSYNLQEVGLGKAFCKFGYDFDIIYYSKSDYNQTIEVPDGSLRILWRRGIRVLRTGIYPKVWKKEFLDKYDIVIASEYDQIMTYILSKRFHNTYLYHGPYYNLFKIPLIETFYDIFFCNKINTHIKKIFCKTEMAKDFIEKKGLANSVVTGVGLDIEKFDNEKDIENKTCCILDKMKNHRNLLYVGTISKRKNVELLIKSFIELKKESKYDDVQMIIIGKDEKKYKSYCKSLIPNNLKKDIIWEDSIKNAQMKFIYKEADIFLLSSLQEIFGMVLLESMHFGVPTISTNNAGANTLIKSGENGIILDSFDEKKWTEAIKSILNNEDYSNNLREKSIETINNNFMWDDIAKKMISYIELK